MQAREAVVAMGSLLEELARRQAEAPQRIEELGRQLAEVQARLEAEKGAVSAAGRLRDGGGNPERAGQ
ncbi:hypothetical protein [Nonomuraea sp. B19D2]|uniref:hypothetical protein n=1 Tax=Nonomuraea sp. B19D2 TaxID=3159561 RepID=UPI0032DBD70D